MAGQGLLLRTEPGFSLPAFERFTPPPPPSLVAARIESGSVPGDIVLDPFGRGGWVARAAIDQQRKGVSLESTPLDRLLAEIVLRPPDLRHLDAAVQALAASARRDSSLKASITDRYASRCTTCARPIVVDELTWVVEEPSDTDSSTRDDAEDAPERTPRPILKHYRCRICRDQLGGSEQRQAELDDQDIARALDQEGVSVREQLLERFPVLEGGEALPDELLDLHTPRQLVALASILERIEDDLRAAPISAALRLAMLHALAPASRLATSPGRTSMLRITGGHVRLPANTRWRERNPWTAFEEGVRVVRGFVQRLESGAWGPVPARLGDDLRSLVEGSGTAVLKQGTPAALAALGLEVEHLAGSPIRPRVKLVVGVPPVRPAAERLAWAYYSTGWVLGRDAAATLPLEALFGPAIRPSWGWQAATITRSLRAIAPALDRDARVTLMLEGDRPEALVASAIGGVSADYRIAAARLAEPGRESGGVVEFVPPGSGAVPGGPRTRANVALPPMVGGAGDPDVAPSGRLFSPPERMANAPFSADDAARAVVDAAVDVLRLRGEPVGFEGLLGEILVGLDRAGHLRRLVRPSAATEGPPEGPGEGAGDAAGPMGSGPGDGSAEPNAQQPTGEPGEHPIRASGERPEGEEGERLEREADRDRALRPATGPERPTGSQPEQRPERPGVHQPTLDLDRDHVDRLLSLVTEALAAADGRRLVRLGDRWWLGDRADRETAAVPLADRVEWAVYSLLSTGGPLSETDFVGRLAGMFTGPDLPDEALISACLASYRSLASTPDRLVTADNLTRRSIEHGELIARLVDLGHRLGFAAWIGARQQARKVGRHHLVQLLDERERAGPPYLGRIHSDDLEEVDVIWYVRGRAAFLWEVEWTAMLGEPVLRRHARLPQDERLVRFLVVLPERVELVRHKLERSPLLRTALEEDGWHLLKADHLREWSGREEVALTDLEPLLGLDPAIERTGDQLALFGG